MSFSPILLLHICSGTAGLLSGAGAVSFRKGSHRHRIAGIVFAISMLSLGASGAYMAIMKFQPGNILGGVFTCYLVATAWMTVRRREEKPSIFEWCALLVGLAITASQLTFGFQAMYSRTGLKYGYPPGPYFFIGSVALLSVVGDIRMFVRGGVSGTQRLVRHLWRMCFAWFIASASLFLARPHLFPAFMRKTGLLYLLTLMPVILMFFWLVRVRFAKPYKRQLAPARGSAYSSPVQPSATIFSKTHSSSAS
jgi:uncharacterized membrane protein